MNHGALAQPDRSWLRKMSMKMVIRIWNQITHEKIIKIVQNASSRGLEYELNASNRTPPRRAGRNAPGGPSGEHEHHDRNVPCGTSPPEG